MAKSLYNIIGVSRDATKGEIEAACRALLKKFDADRPPSEGEAYKKIWRAEIEKARSILTDDSMRVAYDASLPRMQQTAQNPPQVTASMSKQAQDPQTAASIESDLSKAPLLTRPHKAKPLKLIIAFIVGMALLVGGTLSYYLLFTDEGQIRYAYSRYSAVIDDLQYDKAYEFLSKTTREAMTREQWTEKWLKGVNLQQEERFQEAKIDKANGTAKVLSIIFVSGVKQKLNQQQWVKEDGEWRRDYLADNLNKKEFAAWRVMKRIEEEKRRPIAPTIVASSAIDANCSVNGAGEATCTFKNSGNARGANCIRIQLGTYDGLNGGISNNICSGIVEAHDVRQMRQHITFEDPYNRRKSPAEICSDWPRNCKVTVREGK